jgi:DNA polymerase-3 subunit delta
VTLNFGAFNRKKALGNDGPFPVYGIWGDAYLQDKIVDSLLGWSLDADARDFNLDTLDGEGARLADVFALGANLPFLSERRVVLVKRAEKIKDLGGGGEDGGARKKKSAKGASTKAVSSTNRFVDGLATLAPTTVLILARTPETPEPGERAGERCLGAAPDREIDARGMLVNCVVPAKGSSLAVSIVESEAAAREIPLAPGSAAHMVERCGADIALLVGELEKCALRAGIGQSVTPAIVDEMTQSALHNSVFDLSDAIGARAGERALTIVSQVFERGVAPELVLTLIVKHLRQLLQARTFLDAGLPLDASISRRMKPDLMAQLPADGRDNLALALASQNWLGPRLSAQARRFSVAELTRALELAFAADLQLKGIEGDGGFDSKHHSAASIELLVARLCAG